MPTTYRPRWTAGLLSIALLVLGGVAAADDAPKPSSPAGDLARDLVAARQANARPQRRGRPSVWLAVSPAGTQPRKLDTPE